MAIDFSSDVGKLRLRVADISSLPYLPDEVYVNTLADNSNNLPRSAATIAGYILGLLSHKTHRKLAQLEVFGSDAFKQYKEFLILTFKDPMFMQFSPIPVGPGTTTHPLIEFQNSWNRQYAVTQSQQMSFDADISPNDGSRTGILGDGSSLENSL